MQEIGKFVIKEPCHEDWEKMTPQQQGRFCDVCAKCVVDLTKKSPQEILTAYKENEGDMCGRMTVSQLRSKANQPTKPQPKPARWPIAAASLKRIQIFAAAFVALFVLVFNGKTQAQDRPMKGKVAYVKEEGHLEGTVNYDHGEVASGLKVQLKKGNHLIAETLTNDQGEYYFADIRPGHYIISVSAYAWDMFSEKVEIISRKIKRLDMIVFDEAIDGDMEMVPFEPIQEPEVMKVGEIEYVPPADEIPVAVEDTVANYIEEDVLGNIAYTPPVTEPMVETEEPQSLEVPTPLPEFDLTVFPNPTEGTFTAQVKAEKLSPMDIMITDLKGQVLITRTIGKQARGHFSVDLSAFSNGTYILSIQMGNALLERRIIKAE